MNKRISQKDSEDLFSKIQEDNLANDYEIIGISSVSELVEIKELSEYVSLSNEQPVILYSRS